MDPKEIENLISDYHWMKREVVRLDELLFRVGGYSRGRGNDGVAQYGIEATLPKGSSIRSKVELEALDSRERKLLERIGELKNKIDFVEQSEDYLLESMHQVIYSCMMEGMSYRAIGKHIGVSREKVRQLRDEMLSHLCQNCQFCQNWRNLKYKKQLV